MITYNKKDIPEYLQKYFEPVELGLEPTFSEYITKLCNVFDEVKRVLKKEGTCWVNISDTYCSHTFGKSKKSGGLQKKLCQEIEGFPRYINKTNAISDKSLCNIPARFSIEMQNRGWILRNSIIWWKRNCMPSSVKDRFTVDYEFLYFFVKNKKYYFEQQLEISKWADKDKR
ncbi:MAG: DNA methyltransferase, partial [Nanoarchaeota archaeon]